ncbi:MAG: SLC13 family permease [Chloroflexota bacterium]
MSIGRRARVPVSKLLIPLAFGSLLGGVTTLIGTPPNLLVSTALADAGMEPFRLFDFAPMGLIIMVSSIVYMVLIGRHLLPSYANTDTTDLVGQYQLQAHMMELRLLPRSPLLGKTLVESRLGEKHGINVVGIIRNGHVRLGMMPNAHLQADDLLLVHATEEQVQQVTDLLGVSPNGKATLHDADLSSAEAAVSEVVISQKADFIGKSLPEIDFRSRYGLTVLAVRRYDEPVLDQLYEEPLRLGDTLLVHGRRERINALQKNSAFLLLNAVEVEPRRLRKAPMALVIFVGMILLVATGYLHISTAAVLASILLVLGGAIKMDEAYQSIEWQSVFLIAGMLPMGIAMEKTGTAQFLADGIISLVGGMGPKAIMIGLFILTTIITEFMSNAAAAVLVAPIAISAALSLGVDPRAFVMGVGIAASNSFLFPIGHQASVLVYGPGNYRFFDYTKVGLPLTLLIWTLMIIFLPIFWPL